MWVPRYSEGFEWMDFESLVFWFPFSSAFETPLLPMERYQMEDIEMDGEVVVEKGKLKGN